MFCRQIYFYFKIVMILIALLTIGGCVQENAEPVVPSEEAALSLPQNEDNGLEKNKLVEEDITWAGGKYRGKLKDGLPNGNGIWHGQDQESYEGEWQEGMFHGEGIHNSSSESYYRENMQYAGEFSKGKKEGFGTLTWSNGAMYSGDIQNNKIHGYGTLSHTDGSIYEGEFIDHKMQGFWTALAPEAEPPQVDGPASPNIVYHANFPLLIHPHYYYDQSYWSLFEGEAYLHYASKRLDFNMSIAEIIELTGKPLTVEKIYDEDYDGPEADDRIFDFGFMKITASETWISAMQTVSRQIYGPRNIRVGDSYETFILKFPAEGNSIEPFVCERRMFESVNGEKVHYERVLYGTKERNTPFGSVLYNSNQEPLLALFYDRHYQYYEALFYEGRMMVYFKNGTVDSFLLNRG